MPSWEDYRERLGRLNAEAPSESDQRLTQRLVGNAMSELVADPRWKVYTEHLNALRAPKDSVLKEIAQRLTERPMDQKEYFQSMVELSYARGYVKAMNEVVELITALVSRGKAGLPAE